MHYVRKLEQEGFVGFIPGKKIVLTPLGKTKLYPPRDDAKRELLMHACLFACVQ